MNDEDLQQIRGAIHEAVSASEVRLTETMRDMQSEILRGLEAFARGNFAACTASIRPTPTPTSA
jgi:hypothetical protein